MAYILCTHFNAFILQIGNTVTLFNNFYIFSNNDKSWIEERMIDQSDIDKYSYAVVDTDLNIIPKEKLLKNIGEEKWK